MKFNKLLIEIRGGEMLNLKKYTIICIPLVYFFLVVSCLMSHSFVLSIEPARVAELPVNSTFTISVKATDFAHLYGYNISIIFDGSILEATQVTQGSFMGRHGSALWIAPTITSGKIENAAESCMNPNPGAWGSGTLFTATFKVIDKGNSPIQFYRDEIALATPDARILDYFGLLDSWYGDQSSEKGELCISNATELQDAPSAGWIENISKYDITWQDMRNGNYDIYGQLVNPDGTLSGSNFSICDSSGSQLEPTIAYNPEPYLGMLFSLAVWTDYRRGVDSADVYGRLILDGTPISGAGYKIVGGANFQNNPEIANCGSKYLLVWQELIDDGSSMDTSLIYGQLLNNFGQPTGSVINISPSLSSSYEVNHNLDPAIATDKDSAFLISWSYSDWYSISGKSYLQCRIVDTLGNQGEVKNITPYADAGYYYQSSCASSGSNYLVVWIEGGQGGLKTIKGQRVAKNGSLVGSNFTVYQTSNYLVQLTQVIFDGSNFVVLWDEKIDNNNGIDEIKGCAVTTSGVVGSPFVLCASSYQQTFPSGAEGGSAIAIWQDFRNGSDYDIYGYVDFPTGISELTEFSATPQNDYVLLKWRTGVEKESYQWQIQRKEVGYDYITVGKMKAHGNSSMPANYLYKDREVNFTKSYFYRLVKKDFNGHSTFFDPLFVDLTSYYPQKMFIAQNSPNPFGRKTNIKFAIPLNIDDEITRLTIYDISGRLIKNLISKKLEPGCHYVEWDGKDEKGRKVKSGVYFCRLSTGKHHTIKKMLYLK
jgi:hypothetical protein